MDFRFTDKKRLGRDFAISLLMVAFTTLVSLFFKSLDFQDATLTITYLLGVMGVAALTRGKFFGILASFLSVLSFNFFFTQPIFTFYINHPDYFVTFIVMFVASILISSLTTRLTHQTELSNLRQERLRLLDEINRLFIHSVSIQDTLGKVADLSASYFKGEVKIVVLTQGGPLLFKSVVPFETDNDEPTIITHPLTTESEMSGSFSLKTHHPLTEETAQFTLNVANQISAALEKEALLRTQTQAQIEIREQKLRNSLLGAISHDLRTPLATIIGSTDTIIENYDQLNEPIKKELLTNIRDDAEWLIESVENILSFTRVEDGKLKLNKQMESVEDLFGDLISHVVSTSKQKFVLDVPDELLMVPMDGALMEKVLLNLLNNAVKYSPLESEITLRAYRKGKSAVFEVSDHGLGIPKEQHEKIFERFYSGDVGYLTKRKGLGLGLSICKAIVEAHNGSISAHDNHPQGSLFRVELPLDGGLSDE